MKKLIIILISIIFLLSLFYNCQTTEILSTGLWTVTSSNETEVESIEENNILHAKVLVNGNELQQIQAVYNQEFILETGYKYWLTFNAWADSDKIIQTALIGNYSDDILENDTDYLEDKISSFLLTDSKQTFEYEFVMEEDTDNNTALCFYFGNTLGDVHVRNISLEQVGEEIREKPVVSVLEFINNEDSNYLNVTCKTIKDVILFTLESIGKYEVTENEDISNIDEIKQYASENGLDNVIFGMVYIDENEIIQVEASVYDRDEDRITIFEKGSASTIFEVFDVADALVLSLLEGFSNMHIAYGSINIINTGNTEVPISVYIDNKKVGEDIYFIEDVFIGTHNVMVVKEVAGEPFILYNRNIKIEEDEENVININILEISWDLFCQLAENPVTTDPELINSFAQPILDAVETYGQGWIEAYNLSLDGSFHFTNEATVMAHVKIDDLYQDERFIWKLQYNHPEKGYPYTIEISLEINDNVLYKITK